MSHTPLEMPEKFREYAKTRNGDVRIEHYWGAEIDDEWYPESWHITLFREQKMNDGRIWMRLLSTPDDVEAREPMWEMELDLLDMAWERDVEEQGL